MSVPAIPPVTALPVPAPELLSQSTASRDFDSLVTSGLQQLNTQLLNTEVDVQRLASGQVTNLHQVMIGLEEAKASLQLMLQVRNRLFDAYQEVMRMQL